MKKKTVKKLVLAKETVRGLEEATLTKVAAGSDGFYSCRVCYPEEISYSCHC